MHLQSCMRVYSFRIYNGQVTGGGQIVFTLLRYENSAGTGANGNCCDGRWIFCEQNGCDQFWTVCVDNFAGSVSLREAM